MIATDQGVIVRHYGDPAAEYAAAAERVGVVDRSERGLLRIWGREPVKMVAGLITNDIGGAPEGQAVYAAVLTPKGKMVADVRAFRHGAEVLLDTDGAAAAGLLEHLRKFVPPIFARLEDVSADHGMLTVLGPGSGAAVEEAVGVGIALESPEDAYLIAELEGEPVLVVATRYAGAHGIDLLAPTSALAPLWQRLTGAGARPVGHGALEVLRIEAGRPRWGAELDENVIPLEAGLYERAISETKGCYTGQEVIIRILHRGHVNWHLRGLRFGEAPAPERGATLVRARESKVVGRITSACASPRFGETIGLGYVRREIEPPARLRLAEPDGPEVAVVELPFS